LRENFFDEEIACGFKVSKDMKKLWAIQLDLLEKFIEVCDKHNLNYFASYGTLLGAVRHKGFIPWDDDIDITMPRSDFEKLKAIADNEFSNPYFFQTSENDPEFFMGGICRLRNSKTTHIDFMNLGHSCNQGCFIDITALDNVCDNKKKRKKQIKKIEFYKNLLFAKVYGKDFYNLFEFSSSEWQKLYSLAKFIPHKFLCKKFDKVTTSENKKNKTKNLAIFTQKTGDYEYRYFDSNIFEQSILMNFEHLKLPVPSQYMKYISTVWDDGIGLPPEHERDYRHSGIINTEVPYYTYNQSIYTDVFKDIEGKDIVLFGAGQMFDYYMKLHGKKFRPKAVFDNDNKKWNTIKNGINIINPKDLNSYINNNSRIIITNIYFEEIGKQLQELGINDYYIYLQGRKYN